MKKMFWLLLACSFSLQAGERKLLTFEQAHLFKGEALLKPLPEAGAWLDDAGYAETRDGKLCRVDARTGRARVLFDPAACRAAGPSGLDWLRPADRSAGHERLLYSHDGDLYVVFRGAKEPRRLTATAAIEQNPSLSPDGSRVAFTAGGNLFVCATADGRLVQLTRDGSDDILNGYASWVYYEEILGRGSRYRAYEWSPDGRRIAFLRFDDSLVPHFPLFDAGGAYGRLEMQRYPKPGFPNPAVKIGIVDVEGRGTDWISFDDGVDHYLTFLAWGARGDKAYFQWLNRGQDELRVYEYDLAGKKMRPLYRETRKTWLEFLDSGSFVALADGSVLLLSSRSGWSHVYRIGADGGEKALSAGEWSVSRIEAVDEKRGRVYFSADREGSARSDLYRASWRGDPALLRLTPDAGSHRVSVSPRGSFFLDRWSSLRQPPLLQLRDGAGRLVRALGASATPALASYALGRMEIFRIPAADGLPLPASWILPPDFDPGRTYPVVMNVYGGPGSRSVQDVFPFRLGSLYLAQQGIIVLSVDHRGSGHFGMRGMEAMHRCLGKWEIADYTSAVRWLRAQPFVDGGRIGISGGSYGGYVAALALAAAPDFFSCGIAEYAVTDWTLYDSVYTERYMDLPAENPEGYRQASVLTHAGTYRGGLRLTHGSMDDNVHMQNTLRLLDVLLDEGKTVELMVYPGQRHGVRGKKSLENARAELEFWKRHFFPEEVRPVGPAGPARQEKQE